MAATFSRDRLLAEARRARRAYEASGSDKDYRAAQQAIQAARAAGIGLAEIGRNE